MEQKNRNVFQAVLKLSKEPGTRNEDLGFVRMDMVFEVMSPSRLTHRREHVMLEEGIMKPGNSRKYQHLKAVK